MAEPIFHVLADPAAAVGSMLAKSAWRGETIVLTGGTTAGEAYEHAAAFEKDWSACSAWWGDERCVPPEHEGSNYALAKRTLLDRIERSPEIHRIRGELPPPEAAAEYDAALRGVRLDLLLLGLGPDGHVGSLFPGSPQLAERGRLVTSGPAGLEPFVDRVTLTLPAMLSAGRIVVLVKDADKASAVSGAFGGEISDDFPASLLRTGDVPIHVYLDAAAASGLAL